LDSLNDTTRAASVCHADYKAIRWICEYLRLHILPTDTRLSWNYHACRAQRLFYLRPLVNLLPGHVALSHAGPARAGGSKNIPCHGLTLLTSKRPYLRLFV